MTGLPMPTDYLSRTSRADKLADEMDGLTAAYGPEGWGLSNQQRLRLLRCCSMLATALCGPEWDDQHTLVDESAACGVYMHELCQSNDCLCTCHMPDGREPDQLEDAA